MTRSVLQANAATLLNTKLSPTSARAVRSARETALLTQFPALLKNHTLLTPTSALSAASATLHVSSALLLRNKEG